MLDRHLGRGRVPLSGGNLYPDRSLVNATKADRQKGSQVFFYMCTNQDTHTALYFPLLS